MQVFGGYILIGVQDDGSLSGAIDQTEARLFDEASLTSQLQKYLPVTHLACRLVERDGHKVAIIWIGANPSGCAFFHARGAYGDGAKQTTVFVAGDIYWRDGTKSAPMSQQGFEEVIARRVALEKETWMAEQSEVRRRERIELEEGVGTRQLVEGSLGAVDLSLSSTDLAQAALEFVRRDDKVALRHLTIDGLGRAKGAIAANDLEALTDLLDKLTCLAATFLAYDINDRFRDIVALLVEIYGAAFQEDDPSTYGYATSISEDRLPPRAWLGIAERVLALGGLAVRRESWPLASELAVQLPRILKRDGYEVTWLRHAVTMASRAGHLEIEDEAGRTQALSLVALARSTAERLGCLRPDLPDLTDSAREDLLSSIAQFDVLWNVRAISAFGRPEGRAFYPNFARLYQSRVQPIVERLLDDHDMRASLFPGSDAELAAALNEIGHVAQNEGWRFDGFTGWAQDPIEQFIERNLSPS